MIIMKFGGNSLATPDRIRSASILIAERHHESPIVVLSALGDTTNRLLAEAESCITKAPASHHIEAFHLTICEELGLDPNPLQELFTELQEVLQGIRLLKELTTRTRDVVASFGERLSVRVLAAQLQRQGIPAIPLDAWDVGMCTTGEHTNASILPHSAEKCNAFLQEIVATGQLPVVTGFLGKDQKGNITTLGRGGSDLTASFIGAALEAVEVQLWKDVDGILTCDPRRVNGTQCIERLSFEEAAELAYFGAKVLHPTSILPAMQAGIPLCIRNALDPSQPGTLILNPCPPSERLVTAIAPKANQTLVDIVSTRMLGQAGFLAEVFQVFADLGISIDVIATSEVSVSLTISGTESPSSLCERLSSCADIRVQSHVTILNLIGDKRRSSRMLQVALTVLAEQEVEVLMISHGASKVNTNLIIKDSDTDCCLQVLHDRLLINVDNQSGLRAAH